MSKQRFSSGARFRWRGSAYRIVRLLPDGQANLEDLLTGATSIVEISTLVRALFAAELHFLIENKPAPSDFQAENGLESGPLNLSDYPEHLVTIARYRLEVIRPLVEKERRTRADVFARIQQIKTAKPENGENTLQGSVSASAIYRWMGDYLRSGQDLRALLPAVHERGGKAGSRLRSEVETLVEIVIQDRYKVQEKVTIDEVRCELAVRIMEENCLRPAHDQLVLPSRATLARRIEASRDFQNHATRRDRAAARQASTQYGQTPYPDLPLERVEIDHTRSDLIVIDDRDNLPLGRLTLTYCLDMATRYPLGYYLGFEPPSYLTAMECLHHTILPKGDVRSQYGTEHEWLAYGVPGTLVIDNGKEFIGADLEDACLLLGIVLQYTPVQTPIFKAGVERMFGSLNTMLLHTLPGTTFSNPRERGDYDSAQQACVYLSQVDKVLHIFLADIYAERFHRGLKGIPARIWADKTRHGFAPALPPSAEQLPILLGRATTRVLHHYGIEFASLRYNCAELVTLRTRLRGEKARIKYHPADLSCLHVYDPFEQQYLRVPALDQAYTQGLSLWKHRIIRQAVLNEQDKVDIVALGQARRKIQAIVEAGRLRKRQSTRTRMARWDTAGKPTRQVVEQTGAQAPAMLSTASEQRALPSPAAAAGSSLPLDEEPSEAGWEISYVSFKHSDDRVDASGEAVQDG
jgi:putative transposase